MIGADRFINTLNAERQSEHATQRYQRGISDIDMWSFDSFLADAIVFACDWYIAHGHTHPAHLETGSWHAVLADIRDGFSRNSEDAEAPNPSVEVWELLRQHFKYLWD